MSHDPNIVLLGGRVSSIADITPEPGNPNTFKAGTAVRRASSGELLIADNGTSPLIGVSAGPSLTPGDTTMTSVFRVGNDVPLLLQDETAELQVGDILFTAAASGADGNDITIALLDVLSDGSASVVVDGTDITISIEAAVTDAETIADAIAEDPEASALVLATVDGGEEATAQAAAAEAPLAGGSTFEPVLGAVVNIDDVTGKASTGGDATSAKFTSGRKTGLYPDGTTAPCALVNLIGGF